MSLWDQWRAKEKFGAILAVQIYCHEPQDVPGLQEASLAAVRPKLVGAIAEYADRVLAQDGEKSA